MAERHIEIETSDRPGTSICLEFVNTADWDGATPINDDLADYAAVVGWGGRTGLVTTEQSQQLIAQAMQHPQSADVVFQRAVELRGTLRAVFGAIAHHQSPTERSLQRLNAELTQALPHLRIVHGLETGYTWQWQTLPKALDEVLWPIVWAATQLLSQGDLERIRECPGDQCGWLFIDSSRNRSRRWCDMKGCGNRAKANRHYQKHQRSQR